jgi:hypothetical protein
MIPSALPRPSPRELVRDPSEPSLPAGQAKPDLAARVRGAIAAAADSPKRSPMSVDNEIKETAEMIETCLAELRILREIKAQGHEEVDYDVYRILCRQEGA